KAIRQRLAVRKDIDDKADRWRGGCRSSNTAAAADAPNWPNLIFEKLREFRIRHVTYVPDAGQARLIELCQAAHDMEPTVLTTEEEGIGLLAGAWLGGERGVLLMQSSGVGNCINTLSLAKVCGFPLLMIVTMRGEWGEANPWQGPMGRSPRLFYGSPARVRGCRPDLRGWERRAGRAHRL